MQRTIGCHGQKLNGSNYRPCLEGSNQCIAKVLRLAKFILVINKHIVIEETLICQRSVERQTRVICIIVDTCFEERSPRHSQKAFNADVGIVRRNQQRTEQLVFGQRGKSADAEQFRRWKMSRPCAARRALRRLLFARDV